MKNKFKIGDVVSFNSQIGKVKRIAVGYDGVRIFIIETAYRTYYVSEFTNNVKLHKPEYFNLKIFKRLFVTL